MARGADASDSFSGDGYAGFNARYLILRSGEPTDHAAISLFLPSLSLQRENGGPEGSE